MNSGEIKYFVIFYHKHNKIGLKYWGYALNRGYSISECYIVFKLNIHFLIKYTQIKVKSLLKYLKNNYYFMYIINKLPKIKL